MCPGSSWELGRAWWRSSGRWSARQDRHAEYQGGGQRGCYVEHQGGGYQGRRGGGGHAPKFPEEELEQGGGLQGGQL